MFGGLQLRREGALFSTNFYNDQFSGNFGCHISIEVSTCAYLKPQATTLRK